MKSGGLVTAILRFTIWKASGQEAPQAPCLPTFLFLSQLNASVSYRQRAASLASPLFPGHLLRLGFEIYMAAAMCC